MCLSPGFISEPGGKGKMLFPVWLKWGSIDAFVYQKLLPVLKRKRIKTNMEMEDVKSPVPFNFLPAKGRKPLTAEASMRLGPPWPFKSVVSDSACDPDSYEIKMERNIE